VSIAMQQFTNRTVHLDVDLEMRDLFKASLDMAKARLIVAVLIFAALCAGVAYFFWLIGEETIGLEVSPLFVGFPLIAIVGQVLRLRAALKKLLASNTRAQYMFQETSDGYDVNWGNSFAHVAWQDVRRIVEKRDYFRVDFDKCTGTVIPKRAFHQPSDIIVFRDILRSRLKDKARVFAGGAELNDEAY
jgi:hypothetical protein